MYPWRGNNPRHTYAKIIKTAKDNGMQYYIVEQERYDNILKWTVLKLTQHI